MKIGLSVSKFHTYDVIKNINVIELAIVIAKQKSVDLLCFGEAVLQGFHSLNGDYKRDINIAVSLDGKEINILKEMALSHSIALAIGYLEKNGKDIYSSYVVIDKNGQIICNYRRISPGWKERHWDTNYKEGKDIGSFDILGHSFKIAICGDLWFDEEIILRFQAERLLWPVYIDYDYSEWTNGNALIEYAEQAKIAGKDVFLINSILRENDLRAEGRAIYFKDGQILSQLEILEEDILICDI